MGCVASRIDKEERVRICKERKRLMKQLLGYRKEFSNAQLAYLRSLRNTGMTLRQFTESETLELEESTSGVGFPPSPPTPLPPSPPPPPTFSPDLRKFEDKAPQAEEIIELVDEDSEGRTPPPPVPSSSWEYWDPFGSSAMQCERTSPLGELDDDDEERWADTNSEFIEDDGEAVFPTDEVNQLDSKRETVGLVDDNLSMMSSHTKDSSDMAMVIWHKKTLASVIKEVDEYFLKASAVVKDIAVFIDIDAGGTFLYQSIKENKRKRSNSAKVFSALTWSWSSKSLQSNRETGDSSLSGDPRKPGAHCITLQKLYSEEQKLYKDVKEEEISKVEYGRKSSLLQRQEEEHDWIKAEKTRSTLESLESYILSLRESISRSRSTILMLINQELHPQLNALASGLLLTWQTMHKCHQFQNHISQQLNHLTDQQTAEPTTENRLQAAAQLQTEVASWSNSFCKLVKFQREYVRSLSTWIKHTECLEDTESCNSSKLRAAVENWLQGLDKLPDKMVSEAIKCLLSAVHAIVMQQQEEFNACKRSDRLAKKLERELTLLSEVEMKFAGRSFREDANSTLTPKHPLTIRRARVDALKGLVDDEKAKCARSVKTTRAVTLNNLQTSLPKVFQALMAYSSACALIFNVVLNHAVVLEGEDLQATDYEI